MGGALDHQTTHNPIVAHLAVNIVIKTNAVVYIPSNRWTPQRRRRRPRTF